LGFKDFIVRQAGKRTKMKNFLLRNKTLLGVVFGILAGYVHFNCPGLDFQMCETTKDVLSNVGSFLFGAGVLPSDYRQKFVQGKI
jgi:hypothetical protein